MNLFYQLLQELTISYFMQQDRIFSVVRISTALIMYSRGPNKREGLDGNLLIIKCWASFIRPLE